MSECIEWRTNHAKYPRIQRGGRKYGLNRWMVALAYNLDLDGDWHALHTCHNKRCIRVEHLRPGTHAENMADADRPKGERMGNAKLTEAQALEIYHAKGIQQRIAEKYGISQSVVSCIKSGKEWASVTKAKA